MSRSISARVSIPATAARRLGGGSELTGFRDAAGPTEPAQTLTKSPLLPPHLPLSRGLLLRGREHASDSPGRMHRLWGLRAGVSCRPHLLRLCEHSDESCTVFHSFTLRALNSHA
jgi:hypothetical protein